MRKKYEAGFKARVALEAFKGEKTLAQISSEYGVHANQISKWKRDLLRGAAEIFVMRKNSTNNDSSGEKIESLYKAVGELKVENDWLKKNWNLWGKRTDKAL